MWWINSNIENISELSVNLAKETDKKIKIDSKDNSKY